MTEEKKFPLRKELEQDLKQLRKVSASIDQLTKLMVGKELPTSDVKKLIEDHVKEQTAIVDKFISLSNDRDALSAFARIVKEIETKTEYLKTVEDRDVYVKVKKEILRHVEEWINCLEIIIIGVLNQSSR